MRENTAEQERLRQLARVTREERENIQAELQNLGSKEGQRLQQLERADRDAAAAYKWLQDHRNDFEKEVFGPPMLICSVKDKRYSNHVQSSLQRDDFLCFTAQTKNDHRKLTDQFYNKQKLAVAVRTITADLSSFRSPIPREGLRELGLDGYALDFIEGPGPVLAMLCSEKRVHLTGVALNETNEGHYQKLSDGEVINSFATGKTFYRITRRKEYGPGATSIISRTIQPGKWWTDEPVDGSVKAELEKRLQESQREYDELHGQNKELQAKRQALDEESKRIRNEIVRVNIEFPDHPELTLRLGAPEERKEYAATRIQCLESSTGQNR